MVGQVPAVLYGRGMDPVSLVVESKAMGQVLHTKAGANVLVNLEVEGGQRFLTMVRAVQRHPVRGNLVHIDFVNTARDVKTHADVPISLTGESPGVREGGVLEHQLWELKVEALPTDIPASLQVDISGLGLGAYLRAGDVTPPPGVQIMNDPEEIILSVIEPQALKAAEGAVTEAPASDEGVAEAT